MHPAVVATHLTEFAQAWCQALHDIRDNEEKDSAFRGLCQLVQVNPAEICKVRSILEQVSVTSVNLFLQLVMGPQRDRAMANAFARAEPRLLADPLRTEGVGPSRMEQPGLNVPACLEARVNERYSV